MNHDELRGELETTLKDIQNNMKTMRLLKQRYDEESTRIATPHMQSLLEACQTSFPEYKCVLDGAEVFIKPTSLKVWFTKTKAYYAEQIESNFGHKIKFTRTLNFNESGNFRKFYIGLTAGYIQKEVKIKTIAPIFTKLKRSTNV